MHLPHTPTVPQQPTTVRPGAAELDDYVGLTDVALRTSLEPAEGIFIAEGEKVIRRAVAAGYPVRSLLLEEKWLAALADLVDEMAGPVYLADPETLRTVTGYNVHRGALASMARLPLPDPRDLLRSARTVAVLEDLVDHTNVGAVFRSAAGLGVDAVLVTPRCADPLYRRSVKVSMGAVFSVPWSRLEAWPADLSDVRREGRSVLALTPAPDATPLAELPPSVTEWCALLIGAEGPGLTQAALDAADHRVRIPMSGGVDSLNAAAASAVAFYALAQSRR